MKALIILLISFNICFANPFNKIQYMTEEYPPFNFTDKDGIPRGIAVDILTETLKILDADITKKDLQFLPWARAYSLAQAVDAQNVLFSTTRTKERESLFKWAGPISFNHVAVIGLRDSKKEINSDSDLKKYSYTTIRSDISSILLGVKGVKGDKIFDTSKFNHCLKILFNKRADFLAYGEKPAFWLAKQNGYNPTMLKTIYKLDSSPLYFAFNRSVDNKIVEDFQNALDKIINNSLLMEMINNRYIG